MAYRINTLCSSMYKCIYKQISKQDVKIIRIGTKINSVKRAIKKTRDDHSNKKYTGQDTAPFRVLRTLLHLGSSFMKALVAPSSNTKSPL